MKRTFLFAILCCSFITLKAQDKKSNQTEEEQKAMVDTVVAIDSTLLRDNPEYPVPSRVAVITDSTEVELKDYRRSAQIDSVWQQELMNSDLYPKMKKAVQESLLYENDEVYADLPTDTLKARLAKINAKTPFNVEYSKSLESVIHYYLRRNKKGMERIMSLSQFYFPMFEEELDRHNMPLELKYLAVVESALNPQARSRVGATGLWQFMFATGKMHGLDVSSYVDERMDPIKSTKAACEYLSTLYGMFDDWDLALASYNSGPGNVSKAIRRSGGKTNYWDLRKHLPRETAGYIPAFFATMYLFEYADEHNFHPYKPEITYYETDTIQTKELLKFDQVSKVTGIDKELLSFLNPSYKLDMIPYLKDENYYLRLPKKESGVFVANEDVIYDYAKKKLEEKEKTLPKYIEADAKIRYRVRRGDYLGRIAERYGVGVSKLRQWNNLRGNNIHIGQHLTIYPRKPVTSSSSTRVTASKNSSKSAPSEKTYTVRSGDSLWSISRKFPGVTIQNIQKWNDIRSNRLKPGMKLKVSQG